MNDWRRVSLLLICAALAPAGAWAAAPAAAAVTSTGTALDAYLAGLST